MLAETEPEGLDQGNVLKDWGCVLAEIQQDSRKCMPPGIKYEREAWEGGMPPGIKHACT